jgi:hypothetical protein
MPDYRPDLIVIINTVKSALRHSSCFREFVPTLLIRLVRIVRELPSDARDDFFDQCRVEYEIASSTMRDVNHQDEVELKNRMYQAIFRGLGSIIYACRGREDFLSRFRSQWFADVPSLVCDLGLVADRKTWKVYTSFLGKAVRYLPSSCSLALAQVGIRIPIICAFLTDDPALRGPATSVWKSMRW